MAIATDISYIHALDTGLCVAYCKLLVSSLTLDVFVLSSVHERDHVNRPMQSNPCCPRVISKSAKLLRVANRF